MCDFRKLNDMVLAALPFVEEWSRVQAHKDQLEAALPGVAALMLGVGSQYITIPCWLCYAPLLDIPWRQVTQMQGISHRPIGCQRGLLHARSSLGSCLCHKHKHTF